MKTYVLAGALALASFPLCLAASAQSATTGTPAQFITKQPTGEWLAHVFFGAAVQNASGEVVGDVNDLVFSPAGQISTVVLGVGGVLGMGEKNVAVSYSNLAFKVGADGARVIVVALSKEQLKAAPPFVATEKSTYDAMKDKAISLGKSASDAAGQLKDQAIKKVEDLKSDSPKKP